MSDPIFVKTRHVYESYRDFWKLVELSGFPQVFVDEVDAASANTYILPVLNGEVTGWESPRARIIHWNLEWSAYPLHAGINETWHMDKYFAQHIGVKYVPVGGHSGLVHGERVNGVSYDAAYLAYMIPRRQQIYHELEQMGVQLSPTSAWGDLRHLILCNSHIYVHVHQHAHVPGVPALRMVVAAAYRIPVIMEQVPDRGIFGQSGFMMSDYEHLAAFTHQWLEDDNAQMLENYGDALHSILCGQHTFRRVVEEAL